MEILNVTLSGQLPGRRRSSPARSAYFSRNAPCNHQTTTLSKPMKQKIQTCTIRLSSGISPVLTALLLLGSPVHGAIIDSFVVGPQSHVLGPGDAYWGDSVSELDPVHVLGGGRRLTLLADSDAPFRAIEEGAFSAILSGYTPGSLNISAAIVTPPQASSYEPAVLLDYDCPASDWSGFDRIVIRFDSPPTADVTLQTSLNSGGDAYWADTPVPGLPSDRSDVAGLDSDSELHSSKVTSPDSSISPFSLLA